MAVPVSLYLEPLAVGLAVVTFSQILMKSRLRSTSEPGKK